MFFLLYKHTDDGVFDYFPKISDHFPKIFQNCSERQTNVREHFPRISENFRRLPKTFEEDLKMFRWYTNEFKFNLRAKLDISEIIDILTCEDIISTTRYNKLYILKVINFLPQKSNGRPLRSDNNSIKYQNTLKMPLIF